MQTTKQKVFRKFWYAIMQVADLADGPKPFRLLGEDIVLFLDAEGKPAALRDRCCHRTAKLSRGRCQDGLLTCGYHGWTYDRTGRVTRIPQLDDSVATPNYRTTAYHCAEKYGYAWVALEDPIQPILDIPEDSDPQYRRIFQFYERWDTAPLRLMENSFDNAHFAFVHSNTFGDISQPKPSKYELKETDYGFFAHTVIDTLNPPISHRISGVTTPMTTRTMNNHWYKPFCRRLDIAYPSGLRHIIINCATPIDDQQMQLVQLLYRNDTEADCPTQLLIDWDYAITREDKDILETTDPDAALDPRREPHMPSDRPGVIMRRQLMELLATHGENEVFAAA